VIGFTLSKLISAVTNKYNDIWAHCGYVMIKLNRISPYLRAVGKDFESSTVR